MYLPTHFMGMLISLLAIVFAVLVCMAFIENGQPVSEDPYEDDVYEIFIYPVCTAFWWKWIAEKTSE